MATGIGSVVKRLDWRALIFRVVVVLVVVLVAEPVFAVLALASPWAVTFGLLDPTRFSDVDYHLGIHLWHEAQYGTLIGIVYAGSLCALLWKPRQKPVLLQFVIIATIIYSWLVGSSPINLLVALALLIGAYPAPRALVSVRREGAPSKPLLGLSVLAAAGLALNIARNLRWQLAGVGGEHLAAHHWKSAIFLCGLLVLAGVLSALKRPGWKPLGIIVGAALTYLGLAAITIPDQAGSWGYGGGAAAAVVGMAFVVATLREGRMVHRNVVLPQMR